MNRQEFWDAIEYIERQLANGYLDLGLHDYNELDIIKTAMEEYLMNHKHVRIDV